MVYVIQIADFGLYRGDDVGFDIFGAGAGPGDIDGNHVNAEIRKKLCIQARQRNRAQHQHDHHQQIGGIAVANEQADQISGGHLTDFHLLARSDFGETGRDDLIAITDFAAQQNIVADPRDQFDLAFFQALALDDIDRIAVIQSAFG